MDQESNLKRETDQARSGLFDGLLFETTCIEIEMNPPCANGMYGGVRGRRYSTLLDYALSWRLQSENDLRRWRYHSFTGGAIYVVIKKIEAWIGGQVKRGSLRDNSPGGASCISSLSKSDWFLRCSGISVSARSCP